MYCVKCKQETESINITEVISKNNRRMLKGVCSICSSKKCRFIKSDANHASGKGIGDTIISGIGKYLGEMHLPTSTGEYIPGGSFNNLQKYSYCGPGTKYEQRAKEGYLGVNELDSMCKLHDQFYNENHDAEFRNISDTALAHRSNEIANDSKFDDEQRRYAKLVKMIMESKARFGLGINPKVQSQEKSKNSKKGPVKRK